MITTKQVISLLELPGIGVKTVEKLLPLLPAGNPHNLDIYDIMIENRLVKGLTIDIYESLFFKTSFLLEKLENLNIQVYSRFDTEFPSRLKTIPNPPLLIYVQGDIKCLTSYPTVAAIGTRTPTDFGYKIGERAGEFLADQGITVVSGLAKGCDTAGHIGCLRKGGKTAAVLAHGLSTVYPKENTALAHKIVESGGCLVSEYSYDTHPRSNYFIERDRIQSGLSIAVLVIETDIKSGTMHTVRFTIDQGRDLYCINYPDDNKSSVSMGNDSLINEGLAKPVYSKDEFEMLMASVREKHSTRSGDIIF